MMFTVPVACPHDCPDTCAMRVTVNAAGLAIKIEGDPQHPTTDGVLCTKVARYLERLLTSPQASHTTAHQTPGITLEFLAKNGFYS